MQLEGDAYVFMAETTELHLAWHPKSYVPRPSAPGERGASTMHLRRPILKIKTCNNVLRIGGRTQSRQQDTRHSESHRWPGQRVDRYQGIW